MRARSLPHLRAATAVVPAAILLLLGALTPAATARSIGVEGDAIVYRSGPGEEDALILEPSDGDVIVEEIARPAQGPLSLQPGPGCRRQFMHQYAADPKLLCRLDGIGRLVFELGDGDDEVTAIGVDVAVHAQGGPGDDEIIGGTRGDVLDGGPGRDTLAGETGDDRITGRDGETDRLSCDEGRDAVVADASVGNLYADDWVVFGDHRIECEDADVSLLGGEHAVAGWVSRDVTGDTLAYHSMLGRADDVRVRAGRREVEFVARGGIRPLPPCRRPDPAQLDRVVCAASPARLRRLIVELADGDDRAVVARARRSVVRPDELSMIGGPGDDLLDASAWLGDRAFPATAHLNKTRTGAALYGDDSIFRRTDGRDVLVGSPGGDLIWSGRGDDVMRPGPGRDELEDGIFHPSRGRDVAELRDGEPDRYSCSPRVRTTGDLLDRLAGTAGCPLRGSADTRPRGRVDVAITNRRGIPEIGGTARALVRCPRRARVGCWGSIDVDTGGGTSGFALRRGERAVVPLRVWDETPYSVLVATRDGTGRTSTRRVGIAIR